MSIKRFFGKTTSEALRKVRDALGADGVILSNRAADGGVEILALSNNDMAAMIPPPQPEEVESAPQAHQEQQADESWNHKQALLPSARKNALKYALEADTDSKNPARPDTGLSNENNEKQAQWAGAAAIANGRVTPFPVGIPKTAAPVVQAMPDPATAGKTGRSTINAGPSVGVTNDAAVPDASVRQSAEIPARHPARQFRMMGCPAKSIRLQSIPFKWPMRWPRVCSKRSGRCAAPWNSNSPH
jgi:flagellar biosynthesis protein FlhF